MEKNSMKNIVILRNLPSNLIEEAFIILKSNKMAKKLEYIEKFSNHKNKEIKDKKNYIIKEAESVIENYMEKIEFGDQLRKKNVNSKKYKRLKTYSIIISVLFLTLLLAKI